MESTSKQGEGTADEWEVEDPAGPLMHWEGDRSEEDRQRMSNWFLARKAECEKERANPVVKAE